MSARVAKLEALLSRVQTRAEEPRPVRAAAAAPALEDEVVEVEVEEELNASPEPMELDDIGELDEVQEIEEVELDEPGAPESGPVAATSMDDAIDAAEHQPPLTPPPESGEGVANPQVPAHPGPTMSQLGETISLDEGSRQEFELDEPTLSEPPPPPAAASEMEAAIPQSNPKHEKLEVPDNAREELERVRLGDSAPIEARVSARPVISTNVVELVSSSRDFEPKTFLELVDSSLGLK